MYRRGLMLLAAVLCVFGLSSVALAQTSTRFIPDNALRAELQITQDGQALLNGKVYKLTAAAQFRSSENLLMLPQSMVGKVYLARVQLDQAGQLHRAWVLTPAEAAVRVPKLP